MIHPPGYYIHVVALDYIGPFRSRHHALTYAMNNNISYSNFTTMPPAAADITIPQPKPLKTPPAPPAPKEKEPNLLKDFFKYRSE